MCIFRWITACNTILVCYKSGPQLVCISSTSDIVINRWQMENHLLSEWKDSHISSTSVVIGKVSVWWWRVATLRECHHYCNYSSLLPGFAFIHFCCSICLLAVTLVFFIPISAYTVILVLKLVFIFYLLPQALIILVLVRILVRFTLLVLEHFPSTFSCQP